MMIALKKERRRRKRVDVALAIKIAYNKGSLSTQSKNISVLGTYIETEQEIPIGTALEIKVEIPKTAERAHYPRTIPCSGVVFRCQPISSRESKDRFGIGIFFRSFSEGGEERLADYIDLVLLEEKRKGKMYMQKRKEKLAKRGGKR